MSKMLARDESTKNKMTAVETSYFEEEKYPGIEDSGFVDNSVRIEETTGTYNVLDQPIHIESTDILAKTLVDSDSMIKIEEMARSENIHMNYVMKTATDAKDSVDDISKSEEEKGSPRCCNIVQEDKETQGDCTGTMNSYEEKGCRAGDQAEMETTPNEGKGLVGTIQPDGPPRGINQSILLYF